MGYNEDFDSATRPYYFAEWIPGGSYHVYNRAVHNNRLFTANNHHFEFTERLATRITPFAQIFAYALVLNHFHLVLRLLEAWELQQYLLSKKKLFKPERGYLDGRVTYNQLIGFYFGNCFKSYAQSFNRKTGRSGTLLDQTVRRIHIRDNLISRTLIMYVHTNEMHHRVANTFREQQIRSSYSAYATPGFAPWLSIVPVLERFGGLAAMERRHDGYAKKFRKDLLAFDEKKYFGYGTPRTEQAPYHPWFDDAALDWG